jgi:hypothetical protein
MAYLGLESGCWFLRDQWRKPGSEETFGRTVGSLKEAGIAVGLIVLSGIEDPDLRRRHVEDTARAISSYPLDRGDLVYVSPIRSGNGELSAEESWDQALDLCARLRTKGRRVAIYDLDRFTY